MRRRLLLLCVAVIVAGVVGGRMLTLQPAGVPVAEVTPVALPTFGADVPINSADDSSAPPLGTATPGVAGPTAVVLSSSPWQVLVARGVVPDLTAPTGVAVDAEGNLFVVDFDGDFVQKLSPGGQP